MQTRKLRCKVRPGLFRGEYVVAFPAFVGNQEQRVEFVADSHGVLVDQESSLKDPGYGKLLVLEVERANGVIKVIVPGSGASDASYVNVPGSLISA